MQTLEIILYWLIILAFFGFLGTIAWIVMAALKLKNQAMSSYRRLAGPPIERVKNIAATGRGIVQQETVRVQHMGKSVHRAAGAVKTTVDEGRVVVDSLKDADLEPLMRNAQTALKFATAAASVFKAAGQQGARQPQ